MLRKLMIVLLLVAAALLVAAPVSVDAQGGATKVTYGAEIKGSFGAKDEVQTFTFEGKKGDLIYVKPVSLEETKLLIVSRLDFKDSAGARVGKGTNSLNAFAVAELAKDDTYTIALTAADKGNFQLYLDKTVDLKPGVKVSGKVDVKRYAYYRIKPDADIKLTLEYKRTEGQFGPRFDVQDYTKALVRVSASVGGVDADAFTVTLKVTKGSEYIVSLGPTLLDFDSPKGSSASFEINVSEAK